MRSDVASATLRDRPFSFTELYQHPGPLKEKDPGGSRKGIGIIAGGIAGLTAAYELSQLGHEVAILEGSDRLGGRIRTHYFGDGSYGELGAMGLPTSHGCVLHYVEKFNLPKRSRLPLPHSAPLTRRNPPINAT